MKWAQALGFAAILLASAVGCHGGTSSDANDAGPSDGNVHDGEAGDVPSTDLGIHDAGPVDAGLCGCSYGFHQECGQGEVCQAAYDQPAFAGASMCVPSGPPPAPTGCNLTSSPYDDRNSAPCSAQCVSAQKGSPCGAGVNRTEVGDNFMQWFGAMANAADPGRDNGFPMNGDFTMARANASVPAECREFLAWTALGLYAFCVGDDAIVENHNGWSPIDGWVFKPIPTSSTSSKDPKYCRSEAGALCALAIKDGAAAGGSIGERAADDINTYLRVLKTILRTVGNKAADDVRELNERIGARITRKEPNLLTAEELDRFLEAVQHCRPHHYALILVLFTTTMRIGTALALRCEDLDRERMEFVVVRRLSKRELIPGVKRDRFGEDAPPVLPEVLTALEEHWATFNDAQKASGLMFPAEDGQHHDRSVLRSAFKTVLKRAGVTKRFTVHGCRRTGEKLYGRTAGTRMAMEVAGHRSLAMHNHYTPIDAAEKQDAARKAFGGLRVLEGGRTGSGTSTGTSEVRRDVT